MAPLDPSSVQASDFRVDGAEPLDALVNSVEHDDGEILVGEAIYLKVGDIETDARPTVVLTGEIADKAGNLRTSGTTTEIDDGIAPKLDVTLSSDLDDSEVVITVASSEALQTAPSLRLSANHPEGDVPSIATVSVSRTVGASNPTWTHTYKVSDGDAALVYVVAEATDRRSNTAYVGRGDEDLKDKTDLITFQADDKAPGLKFVDPSGDLLEDNDPEEGAVWLVAQFDDDEYDGDTYLKVALTAVSLTDSAGTVIASSVDDLFPQDKVTCNEVTTTTGTGDDAVTTTTDSNCATHTLAINLTPGDYNISATGVDTAGNSKSGDADFTVTEKEPFELTLQPGVNLVSIPSDPVGDSGNLNNLFEDKPVTIVTTYDRNLDVAGGNPWLRSTRDPETMLFTGDIPSLQPGVAYFVTAGARTTVEITLQTLVGTLPPIIQVRYGYNAVGFWSISGEKEVDMDEYLTGIEWTAAYWYDPTPRSGLEGWRTIRPDTDDMAVAGRGYLILVQFDGTGSPS